MFMSVDLPDPDGPMIDDELSGLDLEGNALEHVNGHLAELEVLHEILDLDDGGHAAHSRIPVLGRPARQREPGRRPKRAPPWPTPQRSRGRRPSGRRR